MKYFLTLSIAAASLAGTSALAQDGAPPPEAVPTAPPTTVPITPSDPVAPPADPTAPTPAEQVAEPVSPPAATPAVPATPPTGMTPATPATPATPSANASTAARGLTAEQQTAYDGWPVETRTYFDALSPGRQKLFLRIADADKAKLVALPAAQQETVWVSIEKQEAEQKAKQPAAN